MLAGYDLKGKAVLFHTGWDRHWRTEKYSDGTHPFLTTETAELLVNVRPALVGIDSFNIDDTSAGRRSRPFVAARLTDFLSVEHLC